jgi:hypothetical protein
MKQPDPSTTPNAKKPKHADIEQQSSKLMVEQSSAIMLQALVKGMLLRKSQQRLCGAAVKVQGVWRGHSARRLFIQLAKEGLDSRLHDNGVSIQAVTLASTDL